MLRGCFPTRVNLHICGIECQTICALCNVAEDECREEVILWNNLEHQFHQSGSFSSIIFSILSSMTDARPLFAAILWSIWCAHNACIWENKQAISVSTCLAASDMLHDYNWYNNALVSTLFSAHAMTWQKINR
jgi:hypothetical protein